MNNNNNKKKKRYDVWLLALNQTRSEQCAEEQTQSASQGQKKDTEPSLSATRPDRFHHPPEGILKLD